MTSQLSPPKHALLQSELRVATIQAHADGVLGIALRTTDGSPLPPWEPGAHIEIELVGGLVRHYSLCGRPTDADTWRIAVLREPDGRGGSKHIHDSVREGDRLSIRGLRNNFGLVDSDSYLFIAGGIGITPILPMVEAVAREGRQWTLVYGGRTRNSMAFLDRLGEIAGGDLHVAPQDECGLLDLDHFLGTPLPRTAIYCCGPGPLLDAVEERCTQWPAGALHVERFTARDVPPVRADGAFDVRLARTGRCVNVPSDRTLLEVLEDAGYAIDNSCRAGICGTCEIAVTDGIPEHNDDVLSDDERESNSVILPCVSRSKSAVLTVDL